MSKVSLRTFLILPLILQVVGVAALVGYLSYRGGRQAVTDVVDRLMLEIGSHVNYQLESYLQGPEFITRRNAQLIRLGHLSSGDLPALESHFVQQLQVLPDLSAVAIANEQGDFLAVERPQADTLVVRRLQGADPTHQFYRYVGDGNGENLRLKEVRTNFDPHRDPPSDPWYLRAQRQNAGFWRLVVTLGEGEDQPRLLLARFRPIYDANGTFQGVTAATVYLSQLGAFLRTLQVGDQSLVFIVDSQGYLVATSTGEMPFDARPVPTHAENVAVQPRRRLAIASQHPLTRQIAQHLAAAPAPSGNGVSGARPRDGQVEFDHQRYFMQVIPVGQELDWDLVIVLPQGEVMGAVWGNLQRTLLLCGLALLGSIAVGIWLARRLVRPVVRLSQAAQAFATDGEIPPSQPTQIREIEDLRQALEQMQRQQAASLQQIRASEARFSTFLDRVPFGVAVHDASGQLVLVNAQGRAILSPVMGTGPEDLRSLTDYAYVAGSNRPYPRERLPTALGLQGKAADIDDLEIQGNGHRIPLEIHTIPITDDQGQVLYAINAFQDISARQRAIQAQAIFNEAADALFLVDAVTLKTVDCNQRAVELFEADRPRDLIGILGHTLQKHPFTAAELAVNQRQTEEQGFWSQELEYVTHRGNTFWGLITAKPIQIGASEFHLVRVTDISDRKRAELALQASEARLQIITDSVPGCISYIDADQRYCFVNHTYEVWFGCTRADLLGKTVLEVIGAAAYARTRGYVERVLGGETVTYEAELPYRGGRLRYVNAVLVPDRDDAQTVRGYYALLTDISDRRRTELALQQSEARFREIAATLDQLFFIRSVTTGQFIYISPAYEKIWGYSCASLYANPNGWMDAIHPEDRPQVEKSVADQLNADLTTREYRIIRADGEIRWIFAQITRVQETAAAPERLVGFAADITDRKHIEVELQRAKQAAEAASEAKGRFIANMSHELRSPLNAILGFARVLQADAQLTGDQREQIDIIESSGSHLLSIINQVLDLAAAEAGSLGIKAMPIHLQTLLKDLQDLFSLRVSRQQLSFQIEVGPAVPAVFCTDATKLRQVLINLLDNAFKFTQRGTITLRVGILPPVQADRLHLHFEVEDTGPGVLRAEQETLFEAFSQAQLGQSAQCGTGLGLTISREFVRLMGGSLTLDSEPGRGSCFGFDLVATPAPTSPAVPVPAEGPKVVGLQPHQPRYRVLIVDDSVTNRRLLLRVLSVLDLDLREAENGAVALDQWATWRPHLIFMDLRMPVIDGFSATRQIRQQEQASPGTGAPTVIIAVSATGAEVMPAYPGELQFDGFIAKPFQRSQIFDSLKHHLQLQYRYDAP